MAGRAGRDFGRSPAFRRPGPPVRTVFGLLPRALITACALAVSAPGPVAADSLADTLALAYRNSSLLEQNRAVLRAADEDVAQAVASLRPVVNFVARAGSSYRTTGTTLSGAIELTAEVTVLDFGRGELGVQAARESVLATRQALVGVEQQVLLRAVAAFLDVRSAVDTVALRRSNVRLIEQELQAARDRFEVGEITRTDVAIAEARLAAARSGLAAAEGDLEVAREVYNAAVGRYPGQLRQPPAPPRTAASVAAAREVARRGHPSIRELQHTVAASELNAERASRSRMGSVRLGATADARALGTGGTDQGLGMSLSYSRPIYSGGALSSTHRQALARRDSARAALQLTTAQVLQGVGEAWAALSVARARLAASEEQIRAARTAYDGVREEASLGARTTLDVLNAEQELLDAQAARISAQSAQYFATYQLLSSMGLLTVEHLGLGIPTYDPEAYFNAVRDAPVSSPQGERLDQLLRSLGRN